MQTFTLNLTNPSVTLTTYLLDASPEMADWQIRPAVLVLPGGGYRGCSDREAEPIALAFLAAGYHAFVLRYSLNENAKFPQPLEDAVEALERIRDRFKEWKVDPERIVVCGFSAGGHLAAALGTMGRTRPNALVLAYPCILEAMSAILPWPIPSLEKQVDPKTPPTFLFATAQDELVPVENSLEFAAALNIWKIPFEMHIYQEGVHGLALANPVTANGQEKFIDVRAAQWIDLSLSWLGRIWKQ